MNLREMLPERLAAKGQWWGKSWTLVEGCTKVSTGCRRCWAVALAMRFPARHPGLTTMDGWTGRIQQCPDRLRLPGDTKKPTIWAVWNDLFHEGVRGQFINEAWMRMRNTDRHAFLVLTKRPERMLAWTRTAAEAKCWPIEEIWPANVGLGVSVEDQETADERIPELLATRTALRFVNVGPLLGPVSLRNVRMREGAHVDALTARLWHGQSQTMTIDRPARPEPEDCALDWVIVEAESGPGRRPCELEWVEAIVDECRKARVPVWVKQVQLGAKNRVSRDMSEWPEAVRVREMPDVKLPQ